MIPAGSRLHGLTASLPASAAPPAVVTLTDPSGRVRAVWTIAPGTDGIVWSDLAGFRVESTWTETVSSASATSGTMTSTATTGDTATSTATTGDTATSTPATGDTAAPPTALTYAFHYEGG